MIPLHPANLAARALKECGKSVRRIYRRTVVGPYRLRLAGKSDRVRLVVGASGHFDRGWIPTDVDYLDVTNEDHWSRFLKPGMVDAILAEHVWEHLFPPAAQRGAEVCHKYLKRGGYLRVAVPDGLHPDPGYIERVRPGGTGPGAHDHKVLYTYQTLSAVFSRVGFRVELLEFFDEQGHFHSTEWNSADGMIQRSFNFDSRNQGGLGTYTSILLDAYKVL